MNPENLPENNQEAFDYFNKWRSSIDYDLGEHPEDWGDWWLCFLAGWRGHDDYLS